MNRRASGSMTPDLAALPGRKLFPNITLPGREEADEAIRRLIIGLKHRVSAEEGI